MADHFDSDKFGVIMAFGPFTDANVTTGEANTDMVLGQMNYAVAPGDGSVVGIAACADSAIVAGSITLRAHKASTEFGEYGYPAPVLSSAAQVSYASIRPGAITFSAGDRLGLSLSTTTTLDATNVRDVDGYLFVQIEPS
jgi:hypothetical protein